MLKNSLCIIPSNEKESEICDFIYQTSSILSEKNTVIVFQITNSLSIKDLVFSKIFGRNKNNYKLIKNLKSTTGVGKKNKTIYFTPIQILPFQRFEFIKKINYFLNILGIKTYFFIKREKFSKKILWLFFPQLGFFHKYFSKKWFVIYDMIDYHSSINEKEEKGLEKMKSSLMKRANLVVSISKSLKNKVSKITKKKIHSIPQGFALNIFRKKNTKKYKKIKSKKPIIGFIGGINNRLSIPLLLNLIVKNNQWLFVFVGPIKNDAKKIFDNKNVLHIKTQPKNKIASIISQFDVAIIPYDTSLDFNLYSYPMKVFEYFFMGKPVISTPIKELSLDKFKNLIYIEKSANGFEKQIKKLLKKKWPKEKIIAQKNMAIKNSWENKINEISKLTSY